MYIAPSTNVRSTPPSKRGKTKRTATLFLAIRNHRIERGISQNGLAFLLDLDVNELKSIENGELIPNSQTMFRLVALGFNIAHFMSWNDRFEFSNLELHFLASISRMDAFDAMYFDDALVFYLSCIEQVGHKMDRKQFMKDCIQRGKLVAKNWKKIELMRNSISQISA